MSSATRRPGITSATTSVEHCSVELNRTKCNPPPRLPCNKILAIFVCKCRPFITFLAEWLDLLWESFHDKAVSSLRTPVDKTENNICNVLTGDPARKRGRKGGRGVSIARIKVRFIAAITLAWKFSFNFHQPVMTNEFYNIN